MTDPDKQFATDPDEIEQQLSLDEEELDDLLTLLRSEAERLDREAPKVTVRPVLMQHVVKSGARELSTDLPTTERPDTTTVDQQRTRGKVTPNSQEMSVHHPATDIDGNYAHLVADAQAMSAPLHQLNIHALSDEAFEFALRRQMKNFGASRVFEDPEHLAVLLAIIQQDVDETWAHDTEVASQQDCALKLVPPESFQTIPQAQFITGAPVSLTSYAWLTRYASLTRAFTKIVLTYETSGLILCVNGDQKTSSTPTALTARQIWPTRSALVPAKLYVTTVVVRPLVTAVLLAGVLGIVLTMLAPAQSVVITTSPAPWISRTERQASTLPNALPPVAQAHLLDRTPLGEAASHATHGYEHGDKAAGLSAAPPRSEVTFHFGEDFSAYNQSGHWEMTAHTPAVTTTAGTEMAYLDVRGAIVRLEASHEDSVPVHRPWRFSWLPGDVTTETHDSAKLWSRALLLEDEATASPSWADSASLLPASPNFLDPGRHSTPRYQDRLWTQIRNQGGGWYLSATSTDPAAVREVALSTVLVE